MTIYYCPSCRKEVSARRCPLCGNDADPVAIPAQPPLRSYSIFDHAQAGHTKTINAAALAPIVLTVEVGDVVTFLHTGAKGDITLSGHVTEIVGDTGVITVLLPSGLQWKMYASEVSSVYRGARPGRHG